MTVTVQIFAVFGWLAICGLFSWLVVVAKNRSKLKRRQVVIEYDRHLTLDEIDSIRANLREQGFHGAVVISGGKSHFVWPSPPPLRQPLVIFEDRITTLQEELSKEKMMRTQLECAIRDGDFKRAVWRMSGHYGEDAIEYYKTKHPNQEPFSGVPHVPQPQSKDTDDCLKKVERAVRASKKV